MTGSSLRLAVLALSALLSVGGGSAAYAQAPAQQKYEVTGFRDVRFGMTETEVRNSAAKTFGIKAADLTSTTNAVEGTTVLTAKLASLDPAPGPARIAYIFGYNSKKLIQINVVWGEDPATPPVDVSAMIAAGTRLQGYFAEYAWRKDTTRAGIPVGENTIVLFSGDDEKKGALRLIADGVKFQVEKDGKPVSSPDPKGPPKLIINYIADRENPDVMRIEKGKF